MMLLETMRVSAEGEVYLLDRHLDRLQNSARHFSFICEREKVQASIAGAIRHFEKPSRLRLLLSSVGECHLESEPLSARRLPRYLQISPVRIDSKNPLLYHKTSERQVYEDTRRGCGADADVLLVNERGEVTETTTANVALLRGGKWITPPVSCGLLPGVMWAELLATGEVVEGVMRVDELNAGETVRCFNSVRGIFDLCLNPGS